MFIFILGILFHIFPKFFSEEKKIIVIPFTIRKINYDSKYNSTNFLNDNIFNNILLDLNIGTPSQKVQSKIDHNSNCFLMETYQEEESSHFSNLYFPILSTSIKHFVNKYFYESFNFEGHNESSIEFSIKDYKDGFNYSNYSFIPVLGTNIPQYKDSCPNFFLDVKKQGLIKKLIWTFEYTDKISGNLVIGEDLTVYNKTKYSSDTYYTSYINLNSIITFDSVYINNTKEKNISYINMTQAMLLNIYGLTVGPNSYKRLIDKLFFDFLIKNNICQCDIVKYEYNKKSHAGLDYYVYSCNEKKLKEENKEYFNNFPDLIFSLKSIEHDLIFKKEDLFTKINDKLYFNIIFQTNYDVKEIIWYFGESFYKKYSLTLNFDSKTIGFYFQKENNKDKDKDKDNTKDNKKLILIIVISAECIIIIGLIIMGVVFWKKYRKNRVNEINDDNYEYFADKKVKKEFSVNS